MFLILQGILKQTKMKESKRNVKILGWTQLQLKKKITFTVNKQ